MKKMIYLDNAATTPIDPKVITHMTEILSTQFGNPSSVHAVGRIARNTIEQARKKIAGFMNASPAEITFTSGGTESSNMALRGAVRDLGVTRIISSPIEHPCVHKTLKYLQNNGVEIIHLHVDNLGFADLNELNDLLANSNKKTLVSLMHANNEVGTRNDIHKIGEICKEHNAFFHSDTVQTMGHYQFDLNDLHIHFLSGAAHKFHGPKGVGFLYMSADAKVMPLIHGGGQERDMRAGTENIASISGMALALEIYYENLNEWTSYISGIKEYMREQLLLKLPLVEFNGDPSDEALYTVLSISVCGQDLLLFQLDMAGICCSAGSACSSGTNVGSPVIRFLREEGDDKITLRFSFSHHNTTEEIDYVVDKLVELLPKDNMESHKH